jgi:hypothetical protein
MEGYIYILKLREHINNNEEVYKIGRTNDIIRRTKEYPKGSKIIYTIHCNNMNESETKLKRHLKQYIRKDLGSEYFECDINIIKKYADIVSNISDIQVIKLNNKKTNISTISLSNISNISNDASIAVQKSLPIIMNPEWKTLSKDYKNIIIQNICGDKF